MLQELRFQLTTVLLTVVTIAAAIAAGVNYEQNHKFRLPDDGVVWTERGDNVVAARVIDGGPAERAGIHAGDRLLSIQGRPVEHADDVPRTLAAIGAWGKAAYSLSRDDVEIPATVVIAEVARGAALSYQYLVGVAYLAIGLFIYFRRGSAPKARHFYIFCLTSFIFSCFHYTGKLNAFDQVMYWGNLLANWLAPALFLHFCLGFPEPRAWQRRWMTVAIYVPGLLMTLVGVGFALGAITVSGYSSVEVRYALDRWWMGWLTVAYIASGIVLQSGYLTAEDTVVRQQIKWLRNGILFGFAPFGILYAVPYIFDLPFSPYLNYAVLTLPLVPLTIAYAIVRYRLMDVDVIFRRGYAYTFATVCVLAVFYAIVLGASRLVQASMQDTSSTNLVLMMVVATLLFQPIRNWIQSRLDRYFYRDRYDYRRTLIEFARELNSNSELDPMLQSVADRLMQTLSIRHVAFFLADDASGVENRDETRTEGADPGSTSAGPESTKWKLRMAMGSSARPLESGESFDLSFLDGRQRGPYLFFERTRYHLDVIASAWPASVRKTIADLDLNYYLPCSVRGRTIAYLGVSRTETGEFLASDDVELLLTLANYVGIAIENTNLYRSLKEKADEYERLKEFSENIVESINVGVLAADLDDRVESWNTQMERLSGIGRADAVGRRLAELFPAALVEQLDRTRGEMRIQHLDKFSLDSSSGEATVNIAIAPLVSRDLEQIGRLVIFDDITARAELERRLVQADKLSSIGLLAAGVAHEVNTPLAVISSYAQMLTKQVAGDEQKSRMLEKISRSTFRASEIVNSLLNFSRTWTTELADVQVNAVIQETLALLEHQLHKAGVEVRTDLDAGLEPIRGNQGKLQQVFLNLFLNARDAMEPSGVLQVITRRSEKGVQVDVVDTGHGIAPEHLGRIYDPFFTTKGVKKGTGLGLSVTYGIIQEHGGAIEAVSKPGEGTCFHLEFPVVKKAVHAR
jgi:PAS domain S-box-containing protein